MKSKDSSLGSQRFDAKKPNQSRPLTSSEKASSLADIIGYDFARALDGERRLDRWDIQTLGMLDT